MSQSNDIILSTKGLTKCYAKVEALSDVSLDIKRGEVIAICGENGAGKSTFIKMITGAEQPTSGSVEFNGKNIVGLSPSMVMNLGIAAVYQEFSLIPYLSIAENIFYGREPTHGGILNHAHMRQKAQALFDEMGMRIDVRKRIIDIGVAYQQMVEILKAVCAHS